MRNTRGDNLHIHEHDSKCKIYVVLFSLWWLRWGSPRSLNFAPNLCIISATAED